MYYVYVLRNIKGKHYIGSCSNVENRLKDHNLNCVTSTKNRGPYSLIYQEVVSNATEARKRESEIKSYKGSYRFKKLIKSPPSSSLV